jgi:hypothetical protein
MDQQLVERTTSTGDETTNRPSFPVVVAVINTSPDTVTILTDLLERAGFLVVSTYTHYIRDGSVDLEAFLRTHRPRVIVYDIAPPYERNWQRLQHLRQTILAGYQFVLTTTNPARVEPFVKGDEQVYEVIDKDGSLDEILRDARSRAITTGAIAFRPSNDRTIRAG